MVEGSIRTGIRAEKDLKMREQEILDLINGKQIRELEELIGHTLSEQSKAVILGNPLILQDFSVFRTLLRAIGSVDDLTNINNWLREESSQQLLNADINKDQLKLF